MANNDDLIMTPEKAQQWLDEIVDDLGDIRYVRDEMRVPLETLASDAVQHGVEYTVSSGRVHTWWGESSWGASSLSEVVRLDEDFGALVELDPGETVIRKRYVARRVSAPWEVGE